MLLTHCYTSKQYIAVGDFQPFLVKVNSPKILAAAKPKQYRRSPDLREFLYSQELLGSCEMKEEVLCRRRKVVLL